MTAKLGAGVIGYNQRVGIDRIRRLWPELIKPEPNCPLRFQELGDQANRLWPLAPIGDEFEVDQHDFPERVEHFNADRAAFRAPGDRDGQSAGPGTLPGAI